MSRGGAKLLAASRYVAFFSCRGRSYATWGHKKGKASSLDLKGGRHLTRSLLLGLSQLALPLIPFLPEA